MDQTFRGQEVMRFYRILSLAAILLLSGIFQTLPGAETMKELKRELRQKRSLTGMEKRIRESLEDRKEYLQTGIEKGLIDANEEKRIRRAIERVRIRFEKLKEKDKLTPNDEKNLNKQLAGIYRLTWFCSQQKGVFVLTINGKKFFLKDPWQTKYQKSSLSDKEMEEILNTLNRFWRLNNFLKGSNSGITAEEKTGALARGEKVLLEKYFTLQEVVIQEKKVSSPENKIRKEKKKK